MIMRPTPQSSIWPVYADSRQGGYGTPSFREERPSYGLPGMWGMPGRPGAAGNGLFGSMFGAFPILAGMPFSMPRMSRPVPTFISEAPMTPSWQGHSSGPAPAASGSDLTEGASAFLQRYFSALPWMMRW